MEFWGIEIKPGKPTKVEQEDGYLIHVSQIAIGEFNKVGDKTVQVFVKVGGDDDKQKILIGNLSQKIPQVTLDLIFEQDFEISHECKATGVYLLGYKTVDSMDDELNSDFDSEDEGIPMDMFKNQLEKSNANIEGESDEDEDDSEEDDETPVKVEPPSKKRPNGGAINNNNNAVASKKAKVANQQKPSGGHKGHKCGGVHPPKRN
ncbi:Histone deacetylase HDT4 [Raphanus sativus]|uniref:Histone deacetylase HDT4 n=1 Tax=Raphanus sativus TaxID=3726 RepID=A0A6J0NIS8_RAPSA|nr:histone deacetylase HDT4 [Raphanus sativus]KAJ4903128.1 Histone deacetylase HDT4 [Raphanus sativus]